MTVILGLSNTHNGGVALVRDGEVKAAIQAERISRRKRQLLPLGGEFALAQQCVSYCLESVGLKHEDINAIAITTPWEVKRVRETDLFAYIGGTPQRYLQTGYVPHHLSHMEYVAHYGALSPGIVLVMDGSGSLEADRALFSIQEQHHPKIIDHTCLDGKEVISAYWFDGEQSYLIYRFCPSIAPIDARNSQSTGFLQSIGHYWEWASLYCCGSRNEAGKVMGLAAFGTESRSQLPAGLSISDAGELKLDFSALREAYKEPNVFGLDLSNSQHHQDLAYKVQLETENVILGLLAILKDRFPTENLYLSGGVALNVVANERIHKSGMFKNIILNGSVEDNGTAIGAALALNADLGNTRKHSEVTEYYGRRYDTDDVLKALGDSDFEHAILSEDQLYSLVARLIADDNVVGWFQGRSEFGPRALGNRSILANPTSLVTKYVLDHLMKCRDRYRPYAPVVMEERAGQYFEISGSSPVMMRNVRVLDKRLIAITHIDGTARVQTVNSTQNNRLHSLLSEFEKCSGVPVLLNTSFNLPGEPIVETPSDALQSFALGALDYVILEDVIVARNLPSLDDALCHLTP